VFQKGEKVVCGSKGVCVIEDVATLNISGIDKEREYYILKPIYMAASTVYVPVDVSAQSLRKVLTEEEANELIRKIPDIPLIAISNDKMLEQEYKHCLKTDRCEEWIRILKTISRRKEMRQSEGRKITAIDARYFKIARDCVFGELAAALSIPLDEVERYLNHCMKEEILA